MKSVTQSHWYVLPEVKQQQQSGSLKISVLTLLFLVGNLRLGLGSVSLMVLVAGG